MATMTCPNCGAIIDSTARFCRQCGRPSDSTEATTRNLDAPEVNVDAATRPVYPLPTAPSYAPPNQVMAGMPSDLQRSDSTGLKRLIVVLSSLVGVLLITLALVAAFTVFRKPTPSSGRSGTGVPPPPAVPLEPPDQPAPPVTGEPPPPPEDAEADTEDDLVYPGATKLFEGRDTNGSIIQLQSTDSVRKVADWYTKKLKPSQRVSLPGGLGTVLNARDTKVVIVPSDEGASITIKRGSD